MSIFSIGPRGQKIAANIQEATGSIALLGLYTLLGVGLIAFFKATSPTGPDYSTLLKCAEIAKIAAPITAVALAIFLVSSSFKGPERANLIVN